MTIPKMPSNAVAPKTIAGKRFVVYGFGATGQAITQFLLDRRGAVLVVDDAPEAQFDAALVQQLRSRGVEFQFAPTGHDWMRLMSGVGALIPSPGIDIPRLVLDIATQSRVAIIGDIDLAADAFPGTLIAITGTNGKSTITAWIHHLLTSSGCDARIGGNFGTTPAVATLDATTDKSWAVWEVSSYQLSHAVRFHPKVAILSNITPDHLQRHGTLAGYAAVKGRIFAAQGVGDSAIYNLDDPEVVNLADKAIPTGVTRLGYSLERTDGAAGVTDGELWVKDSEDTTSKIGRVDDLPIRGAHNVSNALAAALAGLQGGLTVDQLRTALYTFQGLPHRIQPIPTSDGRTWLNDSKSTNPESTLAALSAVQSPYLLILGGAEKGLDYKALLQRLDAHPPALVLTMGPAGDRIANEIDETGSVFHVERVRSLKQAIAVARDRCEPGGTILLSPGAPSFNEFRNYEHRGEVFAKLVAQEALVPAE